LATDWGRDRSARFEEPLKLVALRCPYDSWGLDQTQALFGKIVGLKLNGYGSAYPYGILPVDTYDFIATHLLVCAFSECKLRPLCAFKTVDNERCRMHGVPFPALALLPATGASLHQKYLQQILNLCHERGTRIAYDSSWAVDPEIRNNRHLMQHILNLLVTTIVHYHLEDNSLQQVGLGVMRFRTEKFFQRLGYKPFVWDGKVLEPIKHPLLRNEEAMLLHLEAYSDEAQRIAEEHAQFWKDRIVL
jgi:hypothetical protein